MLIVLSALAGGFAVVSVLLCSWMTMSLQKPVHVYEDRVLQDNIRGKMSVAVYVP